MGACTTSGGFPIQYIPKCQPATPCWTCLFLTPAIIYTPHAILWSGTHLELALTAAEDLLQGPPCRATSRVMIWEQWKFIELINIDSREKDFGRLAEAMGSNEPGVP